MRFANQEYGQAVSCSNLVNLCLCYRWTNDQREIGLKLLAVCQPVASGRRVRWTGKVFMFFCNEHIVILHFRCSNKREIAFII